MKKSFFVISVSLFSIALCGFGENTPSNATAVSDAHFRKAYVVTPGDHLDIVVRRVPEASRSVVVRSDGEITLPMVKDVAVAGLTTEEVNTKLVGLFSQRLIKPDVTVMATDVHEPTVYVGGEVNNAGAVPLRRAATAIQAISLSGGLKRTAASRSIIIIRLGDDGKLLSIPIQADVHGQSGPYEALATTRLFPDDIIFVPENGRSRLSRFLDDFINRPLTGVNSVLGTYVNFKLVQEISRVAQ
jgi:protein involved in polysaccharide export with SLBB domain